MINARAETVAEKPAYKKAFLEFRCLVIADGFYEWMPVILKEEDYTKWLGKDASLNELKDLLRPFYSKKMDIYEVSKIVNIPSNDFPEVMEPVK